VTVKGAIVVPDAIIVDGVVEGDVTAQSIRIGPSGAIKGKLVSTDIDVSGSLAEKADVKEFLLVRSNGRVEGYVNCGDVQVERGAVLACGTFSVYSADAEVMPVNDTGRRTHPSSVLLLQVTSGRRSTPPNSLSLPTSGATADQGGGSCCGIPERARVNSARPR
jgi:cytoskeletal protein CcmA (bactofilin family)